MNMMRNLQIPIDPTKDNRASKEFILNWNSTVAACAKGFVNMNLDPTKLPDNYANSVYDENAVVDLIEVYDCDEDYEMEDIKDLDHDMMDI